ncbi:hypothetical protein DL96DRAFT_110815 [Flagelloscypha sp. PMI_526]|nr:hypothetical protein DL96DRAFT_110815 [Flagelloscypha sp. PMI_526]
MAATPCSHPSDKTPAVNVDLEPDSNELFVTVLGLETQKDRLPTTTWLMIYKICPIDPSPKFIMVGQLDSKLFGATGASFFDVSRLIVVFNSRRAIWLWYVCQNTLAWWEEGTRIYKMWTSEDGHLVVIPGRTWQGGSIDRASILELPQPLDFSIGSPHCVKIERPLIRTISWKRPQHGDNDPKYRFIDSLASPHMTSTSTFDSLAYFQDMRDGELFRAFAIVRYSLIPSEESSIGLTLNTVHETIFEGAMKILFIQGIRHREIVTHMEDIRLLYYQRGLDEITIHISSISPDPRPNVEQHKQLCTIPVLRQWGATHLFSPETGRACIGEKDGFSIVDFGCNI